jgi:hypothetical protein
MDSLIFQTYFSSFKNSGKSLIISVLKKAYYLEGPEIYSFFQDNKNSRKI